MLGRFSDWLAKGLCGNGRMDDATRQAMYRTWGKAVMRSFDWVD